MYLTKKRNSGRPKGSCLTSTDAEILKLIARLGFQSYQELRLGPLKQFTREHAWACMKKLTQRGEIKKHLGSSGEILGWSLTKKGEKYFPKDETFAMRAPSYSTSYRHDCLLREIQAKLEVSSAITQWVAEQQLRRELMARFHYLHAIDKGEKLGGLPDALLHIYSGDQDSKAALELELTQKSRKRLYKKLEAHILSPDYDFVLYIIEGGNLFSVLADAYSHVLENSMRVKIANKQNGIYFADLAEVQKDALNAKFQGIQDNFSFDDLAA